MSFDPYYEWFGIPRDEQPADHYRLLGIRRFETNPAVIKKAAERRLQLLKAMQPGPSDRLMQQLINEISAARTCLLNPGKRSAYDARLRQPTADRETLEFDLRPPQSEGSSHGSQEFNLAPPSRELELAASDDDDSAPVVQLPSSPAAGRWHELRLVPDDAERRQPEARPSQPTAKATVTRGPALEARPPAAEPISVRAPLAPADLDPPGTVSQRRVPGVPKIPRKPELPKLRRSTPRKSPGRRALIIVGGLAVGAYIGTTLMLIWFYGGGGRRRAVEEQTQRNAPAAVGVDADRDRDRPRTAPRTVRRTSGRSGHGTFRC